MTKYYVFFTRNVLPQPYAHLVQVAHSANAAANLGYPTALLCLRDQSDSLNPLDWVFPFRPRPARAEVARFYNLQDRLQLVPLAMPWPISPKGGKWTNPITMVTKYYFPLFIRPQTQLVHSRDWNFVKTAIKSGIPAIYEHHHHEKKRFEPEIVHSPLLKIAVTVAEPVRESMIQGGMPPEKVITLHNGFNSQFLIREPEAAETWRRKLLTEDRQHLVVYAGGLNAFKGVDLLIEVATQLPDVQFALAGGNDKQVAAYQQLIAEQQASNVKLLGFLPQNELTALLQSADVLAHPHLSGEEATFTSPLKLFDYMASGTPIVATEIPPLKEFKASAAVAAWCEPDHPGAFAQCIQQVLQNCPRRAEGHQRSMEYVNQFSWGNRIEKIMSYVDEPLRPHRSC